MTRTLLVLSLLVPLAACPGTMDVPSDAGSKATPHTGGSSPMATGGGTAQGPAIPGQAVDVDAGGAAPADLAGAPAPDDAAVAAGPADLAVAPSPADLAVAHPADLAVPHVTTPVDMAQPPRDMSAPPDLATLPSPTPGPSGAHRRCGWIGAGDTNGYATFAANATWYDVIHPDWYAINSDSVTIRPIEGEGNTTLLAAAAANHVPVWPLVAGVEDVTWVRNMIQSPTLRAQHIQNLVNLAVSKGYVGLDIDYEHLWNAGDQANFSAFMTELATAMHAAGKKVSDAAEGLDSADANSAWDYSVLGKVLDVVHLMGYDYHTVGTHAGPCAPLGWIDAVNAYAASTGYGAKFVLGIPNYGTTPTWYCAGADCVAACGSSYATTTTEMQSCPFNVDTHYASGRAPHCSTSNGTLYFDDAQSLAEKVNSAKTHGLGGVTYWTVGSEPPGFFDMVKQYY